MTLRRTLLAADQPQEARVFLLLAAFGIGIGVIYWFVSYESAGTVLLLAFGVATGLIGWRLVAAPAARVVRQRARERGTDPIPREEGTGGGTGGVDRPYLDEAGRLPDETIAPFAIGLGVAVAATGLIFGLAPVAVGVLPFAWGAWAWLSGARAELEAQELADATLTDVTLPGVTLPADRADDRSIAPATRPTRRSRTRS